MALNRKKFLNSLKKTQKAVKKELDNREKKAVECLFAVVNGPMIEEIKKVTPVDTGALRAATQTEQNSPSNPLILENTQNYAASVEFGNQRHGDGKKGAFMQHGLDWFVQNGEREIAECMKDD